MQEQAGRDGDKVESPKEEVEEEVPEEPKDEAVSDEEEAGKFCDIHAYHTLHTCIHA